MKKTQLKPAPAKTPRELSTTEIAAVAGGLRNGETGENIRPF